MDYREFAKRVSIVAIAMNGIPSKAPEGDRQDVLLETAVAQVEGSLPQNEWPGVSEIAALREQLADARRKALEEVANAVCGLSSYHATQVIRALTERDWKEP